MNILNFFRKPKVVVCENSEDFYDIIFDNELKNGMFAYPKFSEDFNEMEFAILGDGTTWADENSQKAQISVFAFHWLRYISKNNKSIYRQVLELSDDNKIFSNDEKMFLIQSTINSQSITEIFNDENALNAIFKRVRAYRSIIERLTNMILAFWKENHYEASFYVKKMNEDYPKTKRITRTDLSIQDIDLIFLRDMLSGKTLK